MENEVIFKKIICCETKEKGDYIDNLIKTINEFNEKQINLLKTIIDYMRDVDNVD